ncbi:beta-ketoacyl-[acyl-carrier-protein] synthase family protein [Streptomyces sp. NPDC088752]|uniref:beta-ketoacyl-[acyl-carrier-protein] synthase family protein n=1 Tax=Streptomyces sp. NPDC088752 TaxID=3154963 RepID=UPI0034177A6C
MSDAVRPRAREAVVVTGFGAVTPLGVGADVLHERAVAGASAAAGSRPAVRHADFAPADHLPRALVRRTDRFTHLALVAAGEALARAGHRPGGAPPWRPERVACVIGCGLGGTASFETQREVYGAEGAEFVSPLMVPQMMANAAAAHLSMRYGFRGESLCVASACSSGAQAVGAGMRLLAAGAADAVVVGGAESAVSDVVAAAFANAGALSPGGTARPFDRDRDGFVIGEGAGILVLETASGAAGRGAEVLGTVRGYGATSDAHHVTAPDPTGGPAARAVALALREAATEPGELAYANAHGTGTALNDRLECEALRHALGAGVLAGLPLSSSKGALGHLFGAAGAVEAIVTLQALRHGTAPPTAGLRRPDPALGGLDLVRGAARKLTARAEGASGGGAGALVGLSTSFGFGGHNAALVLAAEGRS